MFIYAGLLAFFLSDFLFIGLSFVDASGFTHALVYNTVEVYENNIVQNKNSVSYSLSHNAKVNI